MGFDLGTFTSFHVVVSLIGIGSGIVVLYGLLLGERFERSTILFLTTTIATSATGFVFPFVQLLPSHIIGIISLVVLAVGMFARYSKHLAGAWRWIYAVSAVLALYFNVFVLIVQAFRRVPALNALAPTQSEPPFLFVQAIVCAAFAALCVAAVRKFHPATRSPNTSAVRATAS